MMKPGSTTEFVSHLEVPANAGDWMTQLPSARIFQIQISKPSKKSVYIPILVYLENGRLNAYAESRLVQIERTLMYLLFWLRETVKNRKLGSKSPKIENVCQNKQKCKNNVKTIPAKFEKN